MALRRFGALLLFSCGLACGDPQTDRALTNSAVAEPLPAQEPPTELPPEVADLLERARSGDPAAQVELADLYESGVGLRDSDAEAVAWYRKAADQGYLEAQYNLGVMLFLGRPSPADTASGIVWIRKAAEAGHAEAQYNLAVLYSMGRGVPADRELSIEWFQRAAEQGHAPAQLGLGARYASDFLGAPDHAKAAQWFRQSAESGLSAGQWRWGVALSEGNGVPRDDVEAYYWLNLSGATQSRANRAIIERVGARLSEEERIQVRLRMVEWTAQQLEE